MPNLSRNNLRLYVLYIDPAHLFCNFGMTKIPMIKLRRKPPKSIILVFLDIVISSFLFEIAYCLYGLLRASHSRNLTPYLHTAYTDSYGLLRASHSRNPTPYLHTAYTDSYGLLRASHSRNPTPYSHTALRIPTDCYVLRTLALLHNIRISRSLRFAFMLILWRVPRS